MNAKVSRMKKCWNKTFLKIKYKKKCFGQNKKKEIIKKCWLRVKRRHFKQNYVSFEESKNMVLFKANIKKQEFRLQNNFILM